MVRILTEQKHKIGSGKKLLKIIRSKKVYK
jgi:hypothetical protein